ncbi:hypothetical protein V1282_000830 [Nitrobacteraceae bacterium AZCC 2146]
MSAHSSSRRIYARERRSCRRLHSGLTKARRYDGEWEAAYGKSLREPNLEGAKYLFVQVPLVQVPFCSSTFGSSTFLVSERSGFSGQPRKRGDRGLQVGQPALSGKAVAVAVTSAFYIVSFIGVRGLLGWASVDKLPVSFKLLQARIVEPHSLEGDPGSIYLWVEALDEGNRPNGVPRAYRIPYSDKLAEKTDKAASEIAAGRPQGGRAADFGNGEGGLLEAVRGSTSPRTLLWTRRGAIPRRERDWSEPHALAMRYRLLRSFRHECRPRTSNRRRRGAGEFHDELL